MRFSLPLSLWVAAAGAVPLAAQAPSPDDRRVWQLEGLATGFCVQLLLDPASEGLRRLPRGYRLLPAKDAADLHVSLRSVLESQPELGSWSPSSLCFYAVDTVRTAEFTLADKSGRHPVLLAAWTVSAADSTAQPSAVLLDLFTDKDRLLRAARRQGSSMHEARLTMGRVPVADEEGRPSTDQRFQVRVGKTLITWDGHSGSARGGPAPGELEMRWVSVGESGVPVPGGVSLRPASSQPMIGSLKVEGKDALAKALKSSPSRFAGPDYRGGGGALWLGR